MHCFLRRHKLYLRARPGEFILGPFWSVDMNSDVCLNFSSSQEMEHQDVKLPLYLLLWSLLFCSGSMCVPQALETTPLVMPDDFQFCTHCLQFQG